MVEITSLGLSSFKIAGKTASIVCDPYLDSAVGLKFPRVEADIVTISHDHSNHNSRGGVKGEFICFDSPGEYEIKETEITGIKSYHDESNGVIRGQNTIFVYEVDNIKICHLGDLGHELDSEQIEKIDGVDVLFIPVGGGTALDAKRAAKVISAIAPKIVIPMHYKVGNRNDLESVDLFLREIGKDPKKLTELKIKSAKDLPEDLEIYILESKGK